MGKTCRGSEFRARGSGSTRRLNRVGIVGDPRESFLWDALVARVLRAGERPQAKELRRRRSCTLSQGLSPGDTYLNARKARVSPEVEMQRVFSCLGFGAQVSLLPELAGIGQCPCQLAHRPTILGSDAQVIRNT
ncbi:hypothetical protein SKAU_G00374550 [Synaphobranchus kaupii]|uniref:Uncharacterized protein n=1 Tax=Synaphobranchus kaupii TaxID=118154 RepID=A0A9Q1IGB4_SYNKA|nr:hypothetical protein SKAU_G00374550 [Synaphobranchus kaupii]